MIVAEPAALPVTTPLVLTVATEVLLEVHVTALFVALEGDTVAVKAFVAPTAIEAVEGLTVTLVTFTVEVTGSKYHF